MMILDGIDIIKEAEAANREFGRFFDIVQKVIKESVKENDKEDGKKGCKCSNECSSSCGGCTEKKETPEIVHCCDCANTDEKGFCHAMGRYTKHDGFCHLAQKKQDMCQLTDEQFEILSSLFSLGFTKLRDMGAAYEALKDYGYVYLRKEYFKYLAPLFGRNSEIDVEKILDTQVFDIVRNEE